jgi:HK97 family phage prohead protease
MTEQEMEQLMQRLSAGREYRLMQSFSVRSNSDNDSGMIADGYATTFNQPYLLYDFGDYKVYEQIDSRAFDDCDMSDVIMQYDHRGRVFARTSNKTLELNPDNIGLYFRADLSGTTIGNQLYEEIKGGYTTKMSFGFVVGEQKSEYVEDKEHNTVTVTRTITKIRKLYDVSAVSIPANDATQISARSISDGLIREIAAERKKALDHIRKRKKLELKLRLMEV